MSTPIPIAATPAARLTAPTAVVSPGSASQALSRSHLWGEGRGEGEREHPGSATAITAPPEASKSTAELIKELERKRLALEVQIKKLRLESAKPLSLDAATAAILPEASSNLSSQRIPTSPISSLPALPAALQKLVGSGLNTPDLAHLCEQGRISRTTHSPEMLERRRVTKDLLPYVFNADPVKVAAFFATPGTPKKMVLTKTSYREGYFSKELNQFVCFRRWTRVSPLQAAALSLDNFLVLELLPHIENDATLRLQAAQQLQEILNRKEVKVKAESENVNSVPTFSSSSSSLMTWLHPFFKDKDKGKVEAEVEADLNIYQAPFKALLKAYDDYITQFYTLLSARDYNELERLWGSVGECHRRLPTYGLQEFCDNKPFDPIPLFTTPPHRGICRYYNDAPLDLDGIGLKTFCGLYKYQARGLFCPCWSWLPRCADPLALDSAAINRLCELRQAELENIIKCLLTPGAAVTLRADESAVVKPAF